jgi:hypothetical protein
MGYEKKLLTKGINSIIDPSSAFSVAISIRMNLSEVINKVWDPKSAIQLA